MSKAARSHRTPTRNLAVLTSLSIAAVATGVSAQTPTYSLEAVSINSVPLPRGSADAVTAAPGDRIVVKAYVRDWSPEGQKLRAYQAQLDPQSFVSGTGGTVQPVGFEAFRLAGQENNDNAWIDLDDERYVHSGIKGIQLTDTRNAPGYRWLTVILDPEEGPVSPQDGTRFYCGTVNLEVSKDAEGTFTVGFLQSPISSGLLDPSNRQIAPIAYEPLVVEVRDDVVHLAIVSSDPPNGAIDARQVRKRPRGGTGGWDSFTITFSADAANLSPDDFVVTDGTSDPPRIRTATPAGSVVACKLDRGIRTGSWTSITYKPTGGRLRFGFLPGDVNNDGVRDERDVHALVDALNGSVALPAYRVDIDGDGSVSGADILLVLDMNAPAAGAVTLPVRLR